VKTRFQAFAFKLNSYRYTPVQEMSSSSNVPDAHVRATRVLQAFEAGGCTS
jgi:hypothetical protein